MTKKRIAFIGTGVMGASIIKHLLKNGHEVTVYTRTQEKAKPLVALGRHGQARLLKHLEIMKLPLQWLAILQM